MLGPRPSTRLLGAFLLLVGTANRASAADPTPKDRAREILIRAAKVYAKGDLANALKLFEAAYTTYPSPKILYNFGLAHERMGRPAQALQAYERFLQDASDGPAEQLADAKQRVARLSKRVAFVTISSDAEGAEALLDGSAVGRTPLTIRMPVDPGQHAVVIRGKELQGRSTTFTVAAGQSTEVTLRSAPPAQSAQAEELVRKGVELRKAGKHLEAYEYFRRAFDLSPTARPTAQLGLVEYQLGNWVDAEAHLEQALRSSDDAWIKENRETLADALRVVQSHIGFIAIKGKPDGATVTVNERPVGKLPLPALIKAGEGYAEVVVSAPGYVPAKRTLQIPAQLTQQLFVTMETVAGSQVAATVAATEAESKDFGGQTPGRPRLRAAGTVLGVMGALGLGFGGYESYRVHALNHQVRRSDTKGVTSGRSAEQSQWWGYGAGAGAAILGGLLYWLGQPSNPESLSLALDPQITRDLMVLSVRARL